MASYACNRKPQVAQAKRLDQLSYILSSIQFSVYETIKGAGQHVAGQGLPCTFTKQTVCQPIGTEVFGEDILLLVDKKGLVCKYAGQALASNIWPAPVKIEDAW